jgi:predicted NAD/FAD-dependent oxidoreductase
MQGELHNNVRMTWGKTILNWKQTPQEALATIIDLNHRYALDGRDPASYGGILWCLGQFDRPFDPEKHIFGTVRPRSTAQHAERLDPQKYLTHVTEPRFDPVEHVAVIGAGISGLAAARTLQDHGVKVSVFDKSRGVGGRMSTRRVEGGVTFDHGAQYFTARDQHFKRHVESWIEQGIVGQWPDQSLGSDQKIAVLEDGVTKSESKSNDRFVSLPTMNALCKHIADGVPIQKQTRVAKIDCLKGGVESGVELFDDSEISLGKFDRVIVSAPAEQTAELLSKFTELAKPISNIQMNPCWATMVAFDKPVTNQWVGAFLHGSFLSWAARNNSKPGRSNNGDHVVIHANPDWTAEHWEQEREEVAEMMLTEFWRVTGATPQPHHYLQSHRWKYAIPVDPSEMRCFADESAVIVACGDWASGSRVEGAYLSGIAAAGRVLGTLVAGEKEKPQQSLLFQ